MTVAITVVQPSFCQTRCVAGAPGSVREQCLRFPPGCERPKEERRTALSTRSKNRWQRAYRCSSLLSLLKLDQRAAEIFRMQEQDRFAMRADLWLPIAEHARTLRLECVARSADVRHFIAYVMNAAVWIALEEFCDRR